MENFGIQGIMMDRSMAGGFVSASVKKSLRFIVISTEVEKSHALTAQVELWTEISGLRVSIAPNKVTAITTGSPARDDTAAGSVP